MYETAQELVAERRDEGEIDVVSQLAEPALDRVIADYFGTPGPDTATQVRWARNVFQELFINVGNLPTVRERAHADAAQWRPHLDGLIDARKAQLQAGEDVPDDVLTRLLRYQDEGEPNFHDIAIRHNILGNITGWIPTISNAFPRIVDELLEQDQLEGAQEAARAGDRELVAAYCFEASRFNPQNFALLRYVPRTRRSPPAPTARRRSRRARRCSPRRCRRCTTSARSTTPTRFAPTARGATTCSSATACTRATASRSCARSCPRWRPRCSRARALERARGGDGKLRFKGPFPSGLTVRFDD